MTPSFFDKVAAWEKQARLARVKLYVTLPDGREMVVDAVGPNYLDISDRNVEARVGAAYVNEELADKSRWKKRALDKAGTPAPAETVEAVTTVKATTGIAKLHTGGYIEASQTE